MACSPQFPPSPFRIGHGSVTIQCTHAVESRRLADESLIECSEHSAIDIDHCSPTFLTRTRLGDNVKRKDVWSQCTGHGGPMVAVIGVGDVQTWTPVCSSIADQDVHRTATPSRCMFSCTSANSPSFLPSDSTSRMQRKMAGCALMPQTVC